MAEVICPSPFVAASSLEANVRVELLAADCPDVITWNPSDKAANIVLSNEDLTVGASSNGTGSVRATRSVSVGKWYWEVKIESGSAVHWVGIGTSAAAITQQPGQNPHSYGLEEDGDKWYNGTPASYGNSYGSGDTVGIAIDLDSGKIWWAINNVWQASGNPVTGVSPAYTGVSGAFSPMYSPGYTSSSATGRFKSSDQIYSPPAGFSALQLPKNFLPFTAEGSLSISSIYPGYIELTEAFSAETSLVSSGLQQEISAGILSSAASGQSNTRAELLAGAFHAVTNFSCDHCFNYAQIDATCPTPSCKMAAVFRYARLQAEAPAPTASFRVGKRIEGDSPVPEFTCTAYIGRNPSIIASVSVPTCSMRVGISLSDETGVPVPTCSMVADTHHLATLFGNIPTPTCEIIADTENIAVISASVPCPRGLFATTIGNVANIYGRVSIPTCSMQALTGIVVSLEGRVPVPGPLVRFYASETNVSITLEGDVPVPTMLSLVRCSLPSSVLRHIRGEVR